MFHPLSEPSAPAAAHPGAGRRPLLAPLLLLLLGLAPAGAVAAGDPLEVCRELQLQGDGPGLRARSQELIAAQGPSPALETVLLGAERLLACASPQAALDLLARVSPAPGDGRRRWLVLQWRAAQAGLHHQQAAQALTLLAEGDPQRLETLLLPLGLPAAVGAEPDRRAALDLLADHLESLGQRRRAAEVLLASSGPGPATAARWGRAVALADTLPLRERDRILELALEQAAADGAWGLVAALLDQQLAAGVSDAASRQALERRLRLGQRLDDAYGEWLQRRQLSGPEHDARNRELEQLLRSPRDPGGHAGGAPGPAAAPDPAIPSSPLP